MTADDVIITNIMNRDRQLTFDLFVQTNAEVVLAEADLQEAIEVRVQYTSEQLLYVLIVLTYSLM